MLLFLLLLLFFFFNDTATTEIYTLSLHDALPICWAKQRLVWSGEAYLSYSLGALAIAGFSVAVFVSVNTVAYPTAFYGPLAGTEESIRTALSSVHATLGFLALLGHLWHAYRAINASVGSTKDTLFDFVFFDESEQQRAL